MPRRNYNSRLDFAISSEDRLIVDAIAYQRGDKDKYAKAARMIVGKGIEAHLASLNEQERAEFDFILSRLKLATEI